MILDSTSKRVRAFLAGAPAVNQPEWNASWADHDGTAQTFVPAHLNGVLNGTTPVDIVTAPGAATTQRQVKLISLFNADTAPVTMTVEVFDGADSRRWIRAVLLTLETLAWEPGGTWTVYDASGIVKRTAPGVLSDHDHTTTGDGGVLTNDVHDGYSELGEIGVPANPAADFVRVYAKDKGGTAELFYKNPSGAERDLSTAGGGFVNTRRIAWMF